MKRGYQYWRRLADRWAKRADAAEERSVIELERSEEFWRRSRVADAKASTARRQKGL